MKVNRMIGGGAMAAAVVLSVGAAVALAQSGTKLVINGSPVTTDARKIGGKTYVPIQDVAKALGMQVTTAGGTISLAPAGGANQIAGKQTAKIGQELFTGKYRFVVNSVQETQKYTMKYANSRIWNKEIEAGDGEKLIVIDCRVKNGTAKRDEILFALDEWAENTALTDLDEGSHTVAAWDCTPDEGSPLGQYMLPGAAIRFAAVFKVPKDVQPKDFVFSIVRYAERSKNLGATVRVSLAP